MIPSIPGTGMLDSSIQRIGAQRSMIGLITMGVCLFALPFIASDAAI
jgi:hypothetical protein